MLWTRYKRHPERSTPMSRTACPIVLSPDERAQLDRLVRARTSPQQQARRAAILLPAPQGAGKPALAAAPGVGPPPRPAARGRRSTWPRAPGRGPPPPPPPPPPPAGPPGVRVRAPWHGGPAGCVRGADRHRARHRPPPASLRRVHRALAPVGRRGAAQRGHPSHPRSGAPALLGRGGRLHCLASLALPLPLAAAACLLALLH